MGDEDFSTRTEEINRQQFDEVYDNTELRTSIRATVRLMGETGNMMESVEGHAGLTSMICLAHTIKLLKGFEKFREKEHGLSVHAEEEMKHQKIAVELLEKVMKAHLDTLGEQTGRKFYETDEQDGTTEN